MSSEAPRPDDASIAEAPSPPRWQALEAIPRRVLGVLIEKAKTTPENYPLSLNALKSGCNQKNNRSPLMQLEEPQVDEALERLRHVGAVAQVQGAGRVDKYRHLAYEWLGVEKVELAVMAELLLRGAQTVGELRGRAARMEPIKDLSDLQPTLDSLQAKGLILYLTPPGRGSVVTHALYLDREMDKVRRDAGAAQSVTGSSMAAPSRVPQDDAPDSSDIAEQLDSLREGIADLRQELATARSDFAAVTDELRRALDQLNQQLGN
jgi:uncharacterized protein YceH (UPF0502 family)